MFPEGTRRSGPVIEDLHEGAAFLAARTGSAILPVGVGGTSASMPKGRKVPRPVKVTLIVGDPIAPPERSGAGRVPRTRSTRSQNSCEPSCSVSTTRRSPTEPVDAQRRWRSRHQVRMITHAYCKPK